MDELALEGGLAFVVDAQGEPVAAASGHGQLSDEERALVSDGLSRGEPVVRTVRALDGVEYLAAFAPVPDLG